MLSRKEQKRKSTQKSTWGEGTGQGFSSRLKGTGARGKEKGLGLGTVKFSSIPSKHPITISPAYLSFDYILIP